MIERLGVKYGRRWILFFTILVIAGIWSHNSFVANGEQREKRVLFISSYTESFMAVPEQIKGIREVFKDEAVELDIEYMDTKRFDTTEKKLQFYESLKYNLEHLPPYDAIMIGDDNALEFAVIHQKELFPDLPIVFLGINHIKWAVEVAKNPYITGIIEEMSIKENIEIAQKFNEKATKVIGIVDDTLTGRGEEVQFVLTQEDFPELEFEILNFSDYTYKEFGTIIEGIEDDSILIFFAMGEDKEGNYVSLERGVELLATHAKIPIYRASIGGVGDGLLGGKMVSYEKTGEIAAQMVLDIFNGTPVESIEVITESPNQYFFDYKLLQKYNIDENLIPKDAVLVNNPFNILDEYKEYIIYASIVLILLIVITVVLFFDNIRRRKMSIALREINDELSIATEELIASQDELQGQYDTIREQVESYKVLNEKYELAIQSTEIVVWEMSVEKKTINISGNIEGVFTRSNGADRNIYEVMDYLLIPEEKQKLIAEYYRYQNREIREINVRLSLKSDEDEQKWVMVRGKGVFNQDDEVDILHGIIMDITKTKKQEEYIDFLAYHDYLTGFPNRMAFMERLETVIKAGNTGAVIMVDIDNFKGINDTLGHVYGDAILIEIAKKFETIQDDKLFISRFGGDEFLLLLKEVSKNGEIETYIRKIKELFSQVFYVEGKMNYINFSMGITCFPEDSIDSNQLITNADTAMYKVKRDGKNGYKFYHDNMKEEVKKKTEIEYIMRDALNDDGFELLYQPKVNTITGDISGFEALLRLKEHRISPGEFIPIAEESGLINKMGRWVTLNTIKQISLWRDKGLEGKRISINFSSEQVKDQGYIDFLVETLKKYQVEPKDLEIEITESIFLEETEATLLYLNRLKEMGLSISLDDFGTGYSSLSYLTYMPVDMVKLDKTLNDKFMETGSKGLIDALISLAHCLNLEITAEGIERVEQYYRLKEGGCDYIQGYLFSKPLKVEEVETIYYENMVEKILGYQE